MANVRAYFNLKDQDKGWKGIVRALKALGHGDTYVKAGLIGEKAQQQHVGSKLTVAELGTVHEYGGGNVPERSFIRAPYDANKERYFSGLRVLLRAVYEGKAKVESALDVIGSNMGHDMRKAIRDNIAPALKPETVARKTAKGRRDPDVALLDTRQLVNAVAHEVVVHGDRGEAEAGQAA